MVLLRCDRLLNPSKNRAGVAEENWGTRRRLVKVPPLPKQPLPIRTRLKGNRWVGGDRIERIESGQINQKPLPIALADKHLDDRSGDSLMLELRNQPGYHY